MKQILFYVSFFLFSTNFLFAQSDMQIEKISPALWEKMMDGDEERFPVYILLADRVDILAMRAVFNQNKTGLDERARLVITTLQDKAEATQGPLLDYLRSLPNSNEGQIQPYWITNVIQAELTEADIKTVSLRRDVDKLELITPPVLYEDKTAESAPPFPNGSEPGLRAIKADKLWQMGYTGYGTRIMIQDSGVELLNPALRLNYLGYYAGNEDAAYTGNNVEGPNDCQIFGIYHGTHVAGTTCGIDRAFNDTVGVAYNAKWMAAPLATLLGACAEASFSELQNYQWALDPDDNPNTINDMPHVINNSFGGLGGCENGTTLADTQDALETAGIAVVWAAGNDGPGASTTSTASDINHDLVISFSVAALNSNYTTAASFSSRGPSDCNNSNPSLLIKPEVSAPGVNVRSSNGTAGYASSQGTSMAAPHVAGAVALLKEAFPDVVGEEIKLALYNTCIDLGEPGEDNTYGMGIIDVLAAFNYLSQNHTPADPHRENDVMIVDIEMGDTECGTGILNSYVLIENAGTEPLTSATINYEVAYENTTITSGTVDWTGSLGIMERAEVVIPEISGLNGNYDLIVTVGNPNNVTDERPLNNIFSIPVRVIETELFESNIIGSTLGTLCIDEQVTVVLDDQIVSADWYVTQSGGVSFYEGTSNEFDPLQVPITFYVEPRLTGTVGIADANDTDTETLSLSNEGLSFDVLSEVNLKSTKLYAQSTGLSLVQLRNPDGSVRKSNVLNISEPGEIIVEWNSVLTPGTGYSLMVGTNSVAFLASTNPTYPYVTGGAVSINGTTEFGQEQDRYLFFYDWNIEYNYACGRIPVRLEFGGSAGPAVAFSVDNATPMPGESIGFTNTTTDATDYVWDFGDGTTSTEANPTHTFEASGTYTVFLSAVNGDGCVASTSQTITVDVNTATEPTWLAEGMAIFPNPVSSQLTIQYDFDQQRSVTTYLTDMLGRTVRQMPQDDIRQGVHQLDVSGLPNGVYYVIVKAGEARAVRKIVKM